MRCVGANEGCGSSTRDNASDAMVKHEVMT